MKARTVLVALLAAALTLTAPSVASSFWAGPNAVDTGLFKVAGGHFVQRVDYTVRYRSVEGAYDDCYVMNYQDDGDATFNLSFDPGARTRIVNRRWSFDGSSSLLSFEKADGSTLHRNFPDVSGLAARHWHGVSSADPGPDAGSSSCESFPPPDPPYQDTSGCGSQDLQSWATGFDLIAVGDDQLDAKLVGPVLKRDPLSPCPSDSQYGISAAPALTRVGRRELRDADPGETVKLSGQGEWSTTQAKDFLIPFDFVSGEQHLRQEWELQLVKLQCGVLGCDDDKARFRGAPDRLERKMKRAVERAKELRDLKQGDIHKIYFTHIIAIKAREPARATSHGRKRSQLLGLVCGKSRRGKHREVAGAFVRPQGHVFAPVTYAGALEEARVTCEQAR